MKGFSVSTLLTLLIATFAKGQLPPLPAWATDKWTATPADYSKGEKRVEHDIRAAQKPLAVLDRYRKSAANGGAAIDPLKRFEWGTAWLLVRESHPEARKQRPYIEKALTEVPFPGNVAYARVCFLVHDWGAGDRRALPIAERLLKLYPDDKAVHYAAAMAYGILGPKEQTARFLELAEDFVRLWPGEERGFSLLGYYYFDRWARFHDKSAIPKALQYNGKALDLGPVDEADRQRLIKMIGRLQKASRE